MLSGQGRGAEDREGFLEKRMAEQALVSKQKLDGWGREASSMGTACVQSRENVSLLH